MNTEIGLASFSDRVAEQQRRLGHAVLITFGPRQNFGPKKAYAYLKNACNFILLKQQPVRNFAMDLPLYGGWYAPLAVQSTVDDCVGHFATYVPFEKEASYMVKFFVNNGEFNTRMFDTLEKTLGTLLQCENDSVYYDFYRLAVNPLQPRSDEFKTTMVEPLKKLYDLLDQKNRIMSPAAEMDPKNLER